jgi:hypothetical protein
MSACLNGMPTLLKVKCLLACWQEAYSCKEQHCRPLPVHWPVVGGKATCYVLNHALQSPLCTEEEFRQLQARILALLRFANIVVFFNPCLTRHPVFNPAFAPPQHLAIAQLLAHLFTRFAQPAAPACLGDKGTSSSSTYPAVLEIKELLAPLGQLGPCAKDHVQLLLHLLLLN